MLHVVISIVGQQQGLHLAQVYYQQSLESESKLNPVPLDSEETFGLVGFESIFTHLEIISNGRPIKVVNDRINISKSKSHNKPKISPAKHNDLPTDHNLEIWYFTNLLHIFFCLYTVEN